MTKTDADFAILGAGALGSIYGAHLARSGHSVVMLVRERRARQINAGGLRVTGLEDFDVRVPVITDPQQLRRAGVLLVTTKAIGTAAALERLRHVRFDTVFSLQNGAFKNELLAEAFGPERVLGALANVSGELRPDGAVLFTRNEMTHVGELHGGPGERASAIAERIERSGVRCRAVPGIVGREWSKFCGWAGYMTMAVAIRSVSWKFVTDPEGALLIARIVREVGALAGALGIELTDDAMLPMASMCSGSEAWAADAVMQANRNLQASAPLHRVSSLQDLDAGRPLELEETVAVALRRAGELGLKMPTLDALYHLCRAVERIQATA
jgi:2-dehydropantoate 2-reductase